MSDARRAENVFSFSSARQTMISLIFLALHSCAKFETPEYEFATWEHAVASGQTGDTKWIPANLAVGAADIKVTYAIDPT